MRGSGMPVNDNVPEQYCRHGRPECDCLDSVAALAGESSTKVFVGDGDSGWHEVGKGQITGFDIKLASGTNGSMSGNTMIGSGGGGGYGGPGGGSWTPAPNPNIPGTATFPNIPNPNILNPTTVNFPGATVLGCADIGHRITNDRNAVTTDEDGTVVGICEVCYQTVYFPGGLKAFDFERAGVMLGKAIAVDTAEESAVGYMLDELAVLEAEIDSQVRRFEAARELLDLARGVVKKRALHDAACSVDAV